MALLTVLSTDPRVARAAAEALGPVAAIARAASWDRLQALVEGRPTTGVVVDSDRLPRGSFARSPEGVLVDLADRFPSVWIVLVARPDMDPMALFDLGKRGLRGLVLTRSDDVYASSIDAVRRAFGASTEALVTRRVSPYLPAREALALRLGLRGVQLGWSAGSLAAQMGVTRPHLSVCLRRAGLPSTGQMLIWSRLLHAARWLTDPGRSGESVSRMLDYANGATFRRVLRNYLGWTPTEIRRRGGLAAVLEAFADRYGLRRAERSRTAA